MGIVLVASAVGGLLLGWLFGSRLWLAAAPRLRIAVSAAGVFLLALVAVVVWPSFGLGSAWFAGVPPDYLACRGVAFGADGLLGGAIGPDVAAISQVPAVTVALVVAALLGGLVCWGVSEVMVRRGPFSIQQA